MRACGSINNLLGKNFRKIANDNLYEYFLDISSFLSFSSFGRSTVYIKKDGNAFVIGGNADGHVMQTMPLTCFSDEQLIKINDLNGVQYKFISATCAYEYTIYLLSVLNSHNRLVISTNTNKRPLFIKTNSNPIKLYSGFNNSAVINEDGSIIIITKQNISNNIFNSYFLPENEKPVSIACLEGSILVVSSNFHVFETRSGKIKFEIVKELEGKNIYEISGVSTHCFAISNDRHVYGRGSNAWGEIGIGQNKSSPNQFIEITTFGSHKIKLASAGFSHSLFLTTEGKVLCCGHNFSKELPINEEGYVYLPKETLIKSDATYCIASSNKSIIFINQPVPPNMPNTRLIVAPSDSPKTPTKTDNDKLIKLEQENEELKTEIASLKKQIARLKNHSKPQNCEISIIDSETFHSLRIVREINVGGSGKVVEVVKEEKYALKMMNVGDTSITNQRNFIKEHEILNQLNHPNIVKTYGIYLSDKTTPFSILLEFCPSDLNKMIKKGNLSNTEIVKYVIQIAEAMKYVHDNKIIHRDLKPSNLLISNDGLIRVSDFGIAKLMTAEEQSTNLGAGTQKFMAPEILKEEEEYNEKVDVYSFGVILFFMLSGGLMPKINIIDVGIGKKAQIPSDFTAFAKEIINKCWNYKPDERPSFNEILEEIQKNRFELLELNDTEFKDIQEFVKEYKKKILYSID